MACEKEHFIYQVGTPCFLEGLTALNEKRTPHFIGTGLKFRCKLVRYDPS
jgi:hypothetical protein